MRTIFLLSALAASCAGCNSNSATAPRDTLSNPCEHVTDSTCAKPIPPKTDSLPPIKKP